MSKLWDEDWAVAYHAPGVLRELADGKETIEIIAGLIEYGYDPQQAADIVDTTRLGLTAAMAVDDGDLDDDSAIEQLRTLGLPGELAPMALALGKEILARADTVDEPAATIDPVRTVDPVGELLERLDGNPADLRRQARAARSVLDDLDAGLPRQTIIEKVRDHDVVPNLDVPEFIECAIVAREAASRISLGADHDTVLQALAAEGLPEYVQLTAIQLLGSEPPDEPPADAPAT